MLCPLCAKRKGRRMCPALGRDICAICCGTKRLREIACPPDCSYLVSARAHPAAVAQRRHDRDMRFVLSLADGLTRSQAHLLVVLQGLVAQSGDDLLMRTTDEDVAQAAGSLAATYETADRGIIYEHRVASAAAQRLLTDVKHLFDRLAREGAGIRDREAALVLRRIERAARTARAQLEDRDTAYLEFVRRTIRQAEAEPAAAGDPLQDAEPRILLP